MSKKKVKGGINYFSLPSLTGMVIICVRGRPGGRGGVFGTVQDRMGRVKKVQNKIYCLKLGN